MQHLGGGTALESGILEMTKKLPYIFDDETIYKLSLDEINFALNIRKLIDFQYGSRFDEGFANRLGLDIGFHFHSADVATWDDSIPVGFFEKISNFGITNLLAIPTGYSYSHANENAIEITAYSPPLVAKIPSSFDQYHKIRGGAVGLYAGLHLLISPCLNYFLLDFNGHHSLIMGPRKFVEGVLGMSVEHSWDEVRKGVLIDSALLNSLRNAMTAYGY